jgi:hypothetical protein
MGIVISTTSQYREAKRFLKGEFLVRTIVSLRSLRILRTRSDGSHEHDFLEPLQENNTLNLKIYLSRRFSSYSDRLYAAENNFAYPDSTNSASYVQKGNSNENIYCRLNSKYSVRCGMSYIKHMDESPFEISNRDLIYKLTFAEILHPLSSGENTPNKNKDSQIYNLSQELQEAAFLANQICAFLSLVRDRDHPCMNDLIYPLFFEYSVNYGGQFISGYMIPLSPELKLESRGDRRNLTITLMHCLEAFLECCPINKRFSQGLFSLSNSLSVNACNTKLITICSAIEYFFSYWIHELSGYETLQENEGISQKLKRHLERYFNGQKTPLLSLFIDFFLADIGVDASKYRILDREEDEKVTFLVLRNDILHGKFIADRDVELSKIVDQALHLAIDIMVSLLALVSASDNKEPYFSLKPVPADNEYYSLSAGWDEIAEAMSEIYSTSETKKYWTS